MTDQELNERLAKALGFWEFGEAALRKFNDGLGAVQRVPRDFSHSTSVDDLRKWVLPELERRGRFPSFVLKVMKKNYPKMRERVWGAMENDKILVDGETSFAGAVSAFAVCAAPLASKLRLRLC